MVRIIDVCSGKGGVGKTTVVANLGFGLQKFGRKVAIVDCNLTTSHLGLYFDLYSSPMTINSFLRNEARLEDIIYSHPTGLKIVPASLELKDIVNIDVSNLRNSLKTAFYNFDIVLLDSAPGLGREALMALQASDEVLFVADPYIPSLIDIVKCYQLINNMDPKPIPLGIIINRTRNKPYEINSTEIREFTGLPIIGIVPEDENVLKSVNKKTLVTILKENSPASQAFFEIAARLVGATYKRPTFWSKVINLFKRKKS